MSTEKGRARAIVKAALAKSYLVGVCADGEEWLVKKSSDLKEIMDHLNATGMDYLSIHHANGARIGTILLVWGNDPSGDELVCDHSVTPEINALIEETAP